MDSYRSHPRSEQERRNRRDRAEEQWRRRTDYEREPIDPFEGQDAPEELEFGDLERDNRRISQDRYPARSQTRYDRGFEQLEDWQQPRQFGRSWEDRSRGGATSGRERYEEPFYGSRSVGQNDAGERGLQPYGAERFGTRQPFGSGRPRGEFEREGEAFGARGRSSNFSGKGPKGYQRSDERIREELSDRMTADPEIDASEISISVSQGEVTLEGSVSNRSMKRAAEDLAEEISGVREVNNRLRLERKDAKIESAGESKAPQSISTFARNADKR